MTKNVIEGTLSTRDTTDKEMETPHEICSRKESETRNTFQYLTTLIKEKPHFLQWCREIANNPPIQMDAEMHISAFLSMFNEDNIHQLSDIRINLTITDPDSKDIKDYEFVFQPQDDSGSLRFKHVRSDLPYTVQHFGKNKKGNWFSELYLQSTNDKAEVVGITTTGVEVITQKEKNTWESNQKELAYVVTGGFSNKLPSQLRAQWLEQHKNDRLHAWPFKKNDVPTHLFMPDSPPHSECSYQEYIKALNVILEGLEEMCRVIHNGRVQNKEFLLSPETPLKKTQPN